MPRSLFPILFSRHASPSISFSSLPERELDSEEEGRSGSDCGGQEEEEKEEGREEGQRRGRRRGRRRRQLGGREGEQEEEGEEGEEEEKEQISGGEDGRRGVVRRGDPGAGASVWAEDGAVSPGCGSVLQSETC